GQDINSTTATQSCFFSTRFGTRVIPTATVRWHSRRRGRPITDEELASYVGCSGAETDSSARTLGESRDHSVDTSFQAAAGISSFGPPPPRSVSSTFSVSIAIEYGFCRKPATAPGGKALRASSSE